MADHESISSIGGHALSNRMARSSLSLVAMAELISVQFVKPSATG